MEALGWSKAELSGLVSSGSLEQQTVPIRTEVRTPVCLTGVLGIVPLEGQGEDKRQVTYLGCHSGEWSLDPGSLDLAPPSLGAGIHTHLDPQSHGLPGPSCCPRYTFLQTVSILESWVLVENSTWAERGEAECTRSSS